MMESHRVQFEPVFVLNNVTLTDMILLHYNLLNHRATSFYYPTKRFALHINILHTHILGLFTYVASERIWFKFKSLFVISEK